MPDTSLAQALTAVNGADRSRRRFICMACAVGFSAACGGGGSSDASPVAALPSGFSRNPDQVPIGAADVTRFAQVFRSQNPSFVDLESELTRLYLAPGSAVLAGFVPARIGSVELLAQAIRTNPGFYAALVEGSDRFTRNAELIGRVRAGYLRMKAVYAEAVFAPTAYLVGRFSTGGTVINAGIGLGIELFSSNVQVRATAPNAFVLRNLREPPASALVAVHEAAHVQQSLAVPFFVSNRRTVLETSLIEGGADFVTQLCMGAFNSVTDEAWALAREAALWQEFRSQMMSTDLSAWIYNQSPTVTERPGDLGYFMGRKICEAYYASASDKAQAVRDILTMRDAPAFLEKSNYAARFAQASVLPMSRLSMIQGRQ